MVWNKQRILDELKKCYDAGKPMSYNALSKKNQALVSAAAYHFGSYRNAVERAGIDYSAVTRRPRWSRQNIIQAIKDAKRKGIDLHWSSVTRRRDELGKAAFASLQHRLFGRWEKALAAAGLDSDEVSRYRRWDKSSIVSDLKELDADGSSLSSGALQTEDPGLHAAAVRHFGTYDSALKAAKVDPSTVRQRRAWTKQLVAKELKLVARQGVDVRASSLKRTHASLHSAATRLFGSLPAANAAAGIKSQSVLKKRAKQ